MSISLSSASARVIGNADLPILTSGIQAMARPTPPRNPNALDVLLITSTESFFQNDASRLECSAQVLQVPMQTLFVEHLAGSSKEEKNAALKRQLQELHQAGKIDVHTQVIISLHGSVHDAPHSLANNKNEFLMATGEMVSLVRESGNTAAHAPDCNGWSGTIHIGACGIGRADQNLKNGSGVTLLYGGRNVKLVRESSAIFSEMIRQLGEYRKDPAVNHFPSAQDFYAAAGTISGEKVHMAGHGNLIYIRSGYLPHPTELAQTAVLEKLQRSLEAKILHGKLVNVQKALDLLGPALKNIKYGPPLFLAVSNHATDAQEKIKILLQAGVDINEQNALGETALHLACVDQSKEMVSFLLQQGANINAVNNRRMSALGMAIYTERLDLIELLIEAGADVNMATNKGVSALHLACEKGDKRLIDWLLQKGADPHKENADFKTPLSMAILAGHFDLAGEMLYSQSAGGNVTSKNYDTDTLLFLLSSNQNNLLHQILGMSSDKPALLALLFAELHGQIQSDYQSRYYTIDQVEHHQKMLAVFIREMLYVEVNMPDYFMSFIDELCRAGIKDYLAVVLSCPNFSERLAADLEGLLEIYRELGATSVCQLLEAALALKLVFSESVDRDLRQRDNPDASGFTPFEKACRENDPEKLIILSAGGVEFKSSRSAASASPLMLACEAGALDVVKWLNAQGVDFAQRDGQGRSALDYAMVSGNADLEAYVRHYLPDSAMAPGASALLQ